MTRRSSGRVSALVAVLVAVGSTMGVACASGASDGAAAPAGTDPATAGGSPTSATRPSVTLAAPTSATRPPASVTSPSATFAAPTTASDPATSSPQTSAPQTSAPQTSGPTATEPAAGAGAEGADEPLPVDFRFQPAGRMTIGVAYPVSAQATPRGVSPDRPLVTFDAAASTTVLPAIVRCAIRGRLAYDAADFRVVDDGPVTVDLCDGRTTAEFTWTVIPQREGPKRLTVVFEYGDAYQFTDKVAAAIAVDVAGSDVLGASVARAADPPGAGGTGSGSRVGLVLAAVAAAVGIGGGGLALSRRRRPAARRRLSAPPAPAATGRPVVFVSYSRRDAEAVTAVEDELEAHGYEVWRDVDDIVGGDAWRAAIVAGLRRSVAVLFVVSPHSAASKQVGQEISLAAEEGKPIIPLVLPGEATLDDALRYILAGKQRIDLGKLSRAEAIERVRRALDAAVAEAGPAAPAPPATPPTAPPRPNSPDGTAPPPVP